MDLPTTLFIECPNCNDETLHNILKSKGKKHIYNITCKCSICEQIHLTTLELPKTIELVINISYGEKTLRKKVKFDTDEELFVGDEIIVDEIPVMITLIETDKRVQNAITNEIKTICAKKYDKLKIKVSINRADKTTSKSIIAVPDEEFYIGDIITFGNIRVVIHSIKTNEKLIKRGYALAREIVRIYSRIIR